MITDTQNAAMPTTAAALVLRLLCLDVLREHNATADEVAGILSRSVLAIRPRISELCRHGLIRDTMLRRPNTSGKLAIVWEACL